MSTTDVGGDRADTLPIGMLSERFGLTLRALRFYENKGLLTPLRKGISRRYTLDDVKKLETLVALKKFGFTLAEIAELLRAETNNGHPYPLTAAQCRKQISFLQDQLKRTQDGLDALREFYATLVAR